MDLTQRKQNLVYASKALAMEGQGDIIWGHVSIRIPEQNAFLMKPHEMGLGEITLDDVITVDMDGNKIGGHRKRHGEWPIHSEIYRRRPEITCVVHTHPPFATTFSALDQKLLPIQGEGAYFTKNLPTFTITTDLITDKAMGVAMAECMGNSYALLLRNHGIVTAGRTVGEAVLTAIFLEKACMCQLLANQYGGPVHWSPEKDVEARHHRSQNNVEMADAAFQYYVRRAQAMDKAGIPI